MIINNDFEKEDLIDIKFQGSKSSVKWVECSTKKLDDKGVLKYKIPYTEKFDYYPIFIARYSLGNLELYLDNGEEKYKKKFFDQIEWLSKNLVMKKNFAVWDHYYHVPFFKFDRTPWVHGLAQGLGMTALLKAYQLTNKKLYLDQAYKVFNSFETEINDGGVKYIDNEGNIWLEEAAILPPPMILNGYITILFAIHELHRITSNSNALKLWIEGIKTLKYNLHKFDSGYWSIYDLRRKYPATSKYHKIHINQLNTLYDLTNDNFFLDYFNKWSLYNIKWLNKKKSTMKRFEIHLKRYGIFECMNRYFKKRNWEKKT